MTVMPVGRKASAEPAAHPVVQSWLADRLGGAAPDDRFRVFVHAEDAAHLDVAKSAILDNDLKAVTT